MSHTVSDNNTGKVSATVPNPEVVAKAVRRHFTADYKRRILQEADACSQSGEVGHSSAEKDCTRPT